MLTTHPPSSAFAQESDLKRLHEGAIKNDPFISQALGPNAKIERMKAASLRLGGQGLRTTYDDHLVIIGDAAGHIDPLTGEGIHTAIMVSIPHHHLVPRPSLKNCSEHFGVACMTVYDQTDTGQQPIPGYSR